jgi:hypothetical protein
MSRLLLRYGGWKRRARPKEQSLVDAAASTGVYQPAIVVEQGVIQVFVGGGQPDYYAGSLSKNLTVSHGARLSRSYECE